MLGWLPDWHLKANASHAGAGDVTQQSQGDDVHGFPERTWSAGISPVAGVRTVCLVDLAFAVTALMTAGRRRVIAGQRHKTPPRARSPSARCAINHLG